MYRYRWRSVSTTQAVIITNTVFCKIRLQNICAPKQQFCGAKSCEMSVALSRLRRIAASQSKIRVDPSVIALTDALTGNERVRAMSCKLAKWNKNKENTAHWYISQLTVSDVLSASNLQSFRNCRWWSVISTKRFNFGVPVTKGCFLDATQERNRKVAKQSKYKHVQWNSTRNSDSFAAYSLDLNPGASQSYEAFLKAEPFRWTLSNCNYSSHSSSILT